MGIPQQFVPCLVPGMPPIPAMVPVGAYPMGPPHIVNGLPVPAAQVPPGVPYPQYRHPGHGPLPPSISDGRHPPVKNENLVMTAKYDHEDCELQDVVVESASKPVSQPMPKTNVELSHVPACNKISSDSENKAVTEKISVVSGAEAMKRVAELDTSGDVAADSFSERTTESVVAAAAPASNQMDESTASSTSQELQDASTPRSPEPQTSTVMTNSFTTEDSVAFGKDDPPLPSHGTTSRSSEPNILGNGPVRSYASFFKNGKTASMAKVTYMSADDGQKQESSASVNKMNEPVELPVPVSEDSAASKLGGKYSNVFI